MPRPPRLGLVLDGLVVRRFAERLVVAGFVAGLVLAGLADRREVTGLLDRSCSAVAVARWTRPLLGGLVRVLLSARLA